MIEQIVVEALDAVGRYLYAHSLGLVDPFWGYAIEGLAVMAVAVLCAWFFSAIRPFAGAVVMAVGAFLVGYWKGESKRPGKRK